MDNFSRRVILIHHTTFNVLVMLLNTGCMSFLNNNNDTSLINKLRLTNIYA
jgi:hypothetical protein